MGGDLDPFVFRFELLPELLCPPGAFVDIPGDRDSVDFYPFQVWFSSLQVNDAWIKRARCLDDDVPVSQEHRDVLVGAVMP